MDDLCIKVDIVLNECSRYLYNIEKKEFHESSFKLIFKDLINGPLLCFVKTIQVFLKTFKNQNVYMLCVCLSQIRKCLLLYEISISEQTTILHFEKVLKAIQQIEKVNINDTDSFFQFDYLSSSLSILERRINTTVLHLISKIFNEPFYIVKKLVRKCGDSVDMQLRNSSDLSSLICDLDKYTDELIQVGLFSVACCKNDEYVIPLKSCLSSLELLDSDMVPAIIEFYLDPTSLVKKTFLKLLINHWVSEICEIQNLLYKIVDPFAFTQTTIETSMNIIDTITKSYANTNMDLYVKFSNEMINFSKFMEKIFTTALFENKELSTTFEEFKNALREYNACLVYNQRTNDSYNDESIKNKLLKRCTIVIKYLKNTQTLISNILDDNSLSELENTNYILSNTKQSSPSMLQTDDLDKNEDLDLLLTTTQVQKSFYNKSERKTSKKMFYQDYDCLTSANETTYDNVVTMDLTKILDNFILESFNINNDNKFTVNIWEEIGIDNPTRIQNLDNVDNKITIVNKLC